MKLWDKLTTARIITTDNRLEIEYPRSTGLFLIFIISFITHLSNNLFAISNILNLITIPILIIVLPLLIFFGIFFSRFNSGTFRISNNNIESYILDDKRNQNGKKGKHLKILEKPYFIDLFVQPTRQYIEITIQYKGQELGHFRLRSGADLTTIIDAMTNLLDLELYDNNNLAKGEVLSFKSKKSGLKPYFSFNIREQPDILLLAYRLDKSVRMEFNFKRQILKNYNKYFELKDIETILIQNDGIKRMVVFVITKDGKKTLFLKYIASEINIIRDKKRLVELLKHKQELNSIKIEAS